MSPRPMRSYVAPLLLCVVCGKAIRSHEPYRLEPAGLRHAVKCLAPLARRRKATA